MQNPFEELEKKLTKRLDQLEELIKETVKPSRGFRVGGISLAQEVTGQSKEAIYKLVQRRRIPFSKPTGTKSLRFDEEKLLDWMRSGAGELAEDIEDKALKIHRP
ncbi:MAG: helix-turn-helix domain-containing protein [Bacteroidetes bacterium]|nr:helix-turn-helix domain-containing protein [Bacteroidota bacterium]